MMLPALRPVIYADFIERALREDLGRGGDLTTDATIAADALADGFILARAEGRLAGLDIARAVFEKLDPALKVVELSIDGQDLAAGQRILKIHGSARSILTAERTALNVLARMCGVATLTRAYVRAVQGSGARIVDTRKTTPLMRALEKYSVRCGGGYNHRFALDDSVLIKDNHLVAAGSVEAAVNAVRRGVGHTVKIELEVDTLEQLEQGLEIGIDVVLLDNMDVATLRRAVELVDGRAITEASGGITLDTAAAIAATGVDLMSVGALTHSAPALDLSLDLVS